MSKTREVGQYVLSFCNVNIHVLTLIAQEIKQLEPLFSLSSPLFSHFCSLKFAEILDFSATILDDFIDTKMSRSEFLTYSKSTRQ